MALRKVSRADLAAGLATYRRRMGSGGFHAILDPAPRIGSEVRSVAEQVIRWRYGVTGLLPDTTEVVRRELVSISRPKRKNRN